MAKLNTAMTNDQKQIQQETRDWLLEFQWGMTHAVTLTMKQYREITNDKGMTTLTLTEDEARKNFRHFMNRLNRSMFGNSSRRLYVIPVLEGKATGKNLHYHCAFGNFRKEMSQEEIAAAIHNAWHKTAFGNIEIKIKPVCTDGWIDYITKEVGLGSADNVDVGNMHIPDAKQK